MVSVKGASAMASEPRYISPLPWPMASGGPWRAPIIRLSSPAKSKAGIKVVADKMQDRFGVGVGLEHVAFGPELVAQFLEILDNAVVHDGKALVHVRMRVALNGHTVRRPTGVADAGMAAQGLLGQPQLQVFQFAFGAPTVEMAVFHGRHPC